MELTCPICKSVVVSTDLKAYCENCSRDFVHSHQRARKPHVVDYFDFDDEIYFRYKKYDAMSGESLIGSYFFMLFFLPLAILVTGLLYRDLGLHWGVYLFALISAFLIYISLHSFLGRQIVRATGSQLQIREIPFPMRKRKKVSREDLVALYTKPFKLEKKPDSETTYRLVMIDKDGKEELLLHDFASPEIPLYIERMIKLFWGWEDLPVKEEAG